QDTKTPQAGSPAGSIDYGLKLAFVLDLNQKLMAHCYEDEKLSCVEGAVPREGIEQVKQKLSTEAWQTALAEWKTAAAGNGAPLGRWNLTGDGARYRMFALPIFTNAPPTAAGAISEKPPDARRGYVVLGYDLAPTETYAQQAAREKADASTRAALYTGA